MRGQLGVGGCPTVTTLELGERRLDLASTAAHRPRHPVERSEPVEHCSANSRDGEGLELDPASRIESFDCVDQPEHPGTDQIAGVDAVGETGTDATGDELDQW